MFLICPEFFWGHARIFFEISAEERLVREIHAVSDVLKRFRCCAQPYLYLLYAALINEIFGCLSRLIAYYCRKIPIAYAKFVGVKRQFAFLCSVLVYESEKAHKQFFLIAYANSAPACNLFLAEIVLVKIETLYQQLGNLNAMLLFRLVKDVAYSSHHVVYVDGIIGWNVTDRVFLHEGEVGWFKTACQFFGYSLCERNVRYNEIITLSYAFEKTGRGKHEHVARF